MADNDYRIAAVVKALKTLKQFDSQHREMTLTELSKACGITRSSMLRILVSLESERFIRYDEQTKKYKLGIAIYHLGNTAFDFLDIRHVAAPILKKVAANNNFFFHLAVLQDDEIIVIDRIWPSQNLDMMALVSTVGGTVPVHCTGVGKVLAAFADREQRDRLLAKCDFKKYTERTIASREEFLLTLEQVRQKGVALNDGEHEAYLRCITRPLYNSEGQVIAALSLSGLRDVITDNLLDNYDKISKRTAFEISKELGYQLR